MMENFSEEYGVEEFQAFHSGIVVLLFGGWVRSDMRSVLSGVTHQVSWSDINCINWLN